MDIALYGGIAMMSTKETLKVVFDHLYKHPQLRGSLTILAKQYRQTNGVLLRSELDPIAAEKLNSVVDDLPELNLGQDYFLNSEFLALCAELRGQNFMRVA